jgi:hypothetical protein
MEIEAIRVIVPSETSGPVAWPLDSMPRFWGGPADGETCEATDTLITKEQLMMEARRLAIRDGLT